MFEDLSRNELIKDLVAANLPAYRDLKRIRSQRKRGRVLDDQQIADSSKIALALCELRRLSSEILQQRYSDLESKRATERTSAARRRHEWQMGADMSQFYSRPINENDLATWKLKDCWTADEAVALSLNRNPKIVRWRRLKEYSEISPFVKEYARRRDLVLRAIQVDVLPHPIRPKEVLAWFKEKNIEFSKEIMLKVGLNSPTDSALLDGALSSEGDSNSQAVFNREVSSEDMFDNLLIGRIAEIFPISKGGLEENEKKWVAYARQANRNGLVIARREKGIGRKGSSFNPYAVGQWLIQNNRMIEREIYSRLLRVLPERSSQYAYLFEQ